MARDRRDRDDDDFDDDRPRRAPRRRPRDDDDFDDDRPRRAPRRRRDDDDDDFDEVARPRAKPAGGNTAVKVLGIVGGVLLVIALICAGLIFMVYRGVARGFDNMQQQQKQHEAAAANTDKGKATAAAEAFMQELKGGRANAAYRLLSADYRRRTTEAEFAKLVAADSAGMGSSFPVRADLFAPDTGTTYIFEVWAGSKTVKLTVIKEDGKWVIDVYNATGG